MLDAFRIANNRPMARHVFLFWSLSSVLVSYASVRLQIPRADDAGATGVFASFWGSGWALARGLDPYARTPFTPVMGHPTLPLTEINLNPPILLPLFRLLSEMQVGTALQVTTIASTALFLGCLGLIVCRREELSPFKVAWLFLVPFFYNTLFMGQVYALLFALSGAAWVMSSERKGLWAGLAIGALVALRPIFSLWIALLWLAGHRRMAATAAAAATALTLASLVAYGPSTFARWLAALGSDQHAILGINASLNGYLARLGCPALARVASAVLVAGACLWAWRTRSGPQEVGLLALTVSMLASPLSWVHYAMLLVPALLARPWNRMLRAAAVLLCLPMQLPLMESLESGLTAALSCAAYPLALLLIAADCAWAGLRGIGLRANVGQARAVALEA